MSTGKLVRISTSPTVYSFILSTWHSRTSPGSLTRHPHDFLARPINPPYVTFFASFPLCAATSNTCNCPSGRTRKARRIRCALAIQIQICLHPHHHVHEHRVCSEVCSVTLSVLWKLGHAAPSRSCPLGLRCSLCALCSMCTSVYVGAASPRVHHGQTD